MKPIYVYRYKTSGKFCSAAYAKRYPKRVKRRRIA